jgi:putative toxin-antitoxin system antitoxin component (TIGR02293 family)
MFGTLAHPPLRTMDTATLDPALEDRLCGHLKRLLGVKTSGGPLAVATADRAQLSRSLIHSLNTQALLRPADVHRVVPRRTWIRRKAEGTLAPAEFDGLYRLVRLRTLADLVFGDAEAAQGWLTTPKERLGGVAPMDFAHDTLGQQVVEDWLHEIDQGYLA